MFLHPRSSNLLLLGRHARRRGVVRAILLLLLTPAAARAPAAEPDAPSVREVEPELFYMEGDRGSLVPVPGFSYRDFMDLVRVRDGIAGPLQPPAAVLDEVVVRIDGRDLRPPEEGAGGRPAVTCPTVAEFTISQTGPGWAAVPLELRGLLLAQPPRHEGPGRMVLDTAPGGGFRVWFDAQPGPGANARHVVTLEGRLPVESGGAWESFDLAMPPAVVSRIEVSSSRPDPAVRSEPAAAERTVQNDAEGSRVALAGLAGDVRVTIASPQGAEPAATAAEAFTESVVRVDGRNAVTDATISLTRLAGDAGRLRISLPSGATLREVRPPATVVARGGSPDRPTVDVAVTVDPTGAASVGLSCERPVDPTGAAPFEPIGFAVEGIPAWRQWGRLSLVVDGEWQVSWNDTADVRRVDPPAAGRRPGFVAAFAYDTVPAVVSMRVRPRRSRVVIEPEYRYDVGAARVTLDARFRVAVQGAAINGITVAVDPTWSIDEVGPPGVVDVAAVSTDGGLITVPFLQALAGDGIVELRASLAVPQDADRLTWRLPAPRAEVVGPALVAVSSRSDIELVPDADALVGLVRQTAAALDTTDRNALVYRLDAAAGTFVAGRRFLPRRIEAELAAQATIGPTEATVEQAIRLNVLHVPLEIVELSIPPSVVDAGFEVRWGDELLDAAGVGEDESPSEPRTFRVILPEPLLGEGEISIRHALPAPDVPPDATVALDVPLILPLEASVGRQTVTVAATEPLTIGMRGEAWRRDAGSAGGVASQSWSAVKSQSTVPLALSTRSGDVARSLVVEAAWLRTRLLPGQREDVATYVVSGATGPIACTLPDDPPGTDGRVVLEVLVGGEPAPDAIRPGGRIVVETPETDPRRRWRLDLRRVIPRDRGWDGLAARFSLPTPLSLAAAAFDPPVIERRFYWTIHTRSDERIVGVPRSWTSQQRWQPAGIGWTQRAVVDDAELAGWIDAVALGSDGDAAVVEPTLVGRSFAYAGIGLPAPAVVWLMPDWLVLLISSGAALGLGLGLVYRPAFRRVPVLVLAAAAAGLMAALAPAAAPLVIQAALPGCGLAIAAWALRGAFDRRDAAPAAASVEPGGVSSLAGARGGASLIVDSAIVGGSSAARSRTS